MKGKKLIRITQKDLRELVKESVKDLLHEAENGGWVVETHEVDRAYNLAAQEFGNEEMNAAIVRCLGDEQLAQCLAYIFRQYDFRKWESERELDDDSSF